MEALPEQFKSGDMHYQFQLIRAMQQIQYKGLKSSLLLHNLTIQTHGKKPTTKARSPKVIRLKTHENLQVRKKQSLFKVLA